MKTRILSAMSILTGFIFSSHGQTVYTLFNDTFESSTLNGASTPGGTPSASSTSYDIAASKNAGCTMANTNLQLSFTAATTSGFLEAQAVFSSTPITLTSVGNFINLTYTFTDVSNVIAPAAIGGTTSSGIYTGLYDAGGVLPLPGYLNNSGLNNTTSSTNATGGAQLWQGYVGDLLGNTAKNFTRPAQNGAGTTAQNQDLIGNNFSGSTTYNNPVGVGGTSSALTATDNYLTNGNQYTISYTITLTAANTFTINEVLYNGAGTNGVAVGGVTDTYSGTVTDANFDGLAIGVRNSSSPALNFAMSINNITITENVSAPVVPATPLSLSNPVWNSGGMQFSINGGTNGQPYRVWATTNLALAPVTNTWTQVSAGTLSGSAIPFADTTATGLAQRFYVVTSP